MKEIVKDAGDLERAVLFTAIVGRDLKVAVEGRAVSLKVEGKLQLSMNSRGHERNLFSRQIAG